MPTAKFLLVAAVAILAVGIWASRRNRLATAPAETPLEPSRTQPGRAAIDAALDTLYPKTRDHRFGLQPAPGEKAPPLEEVVAYRSLAPKPYWHYITYGLSELGNRRAAGQGRSGYGIELTLRLDDASETPPTWPINFLRWLAGTVRRDGNPFGVGHSLPLLPNMLDKVSKGTEAVAFALDAELGSVNTPNGTVEFLQVIPLTSDEYTLAGRWDATRIFAEMKSVSPALLWQPSRTSILKGPRGTLIEQQAKLDGSAQALDYSAELKWDDRTVWLDAIQRHSVIKFLRYRVAYDRQATIRSEDKALTIQCGPVALRLDKNNALLSVPKDEAAALADKLEQSASNSVVDFNGVPLFRLGDMEEAPLPF